MRSALLHRSHFWPDRKPRAVTGRNKRANGDMAASAASADFATTSGSSSIVHGPGLGTFEQRWAEKCRRSTIVKDIGDGCACGCSDAVLTLDGVESQRWTNRERSQQERREFAMNRFQGFMVQASSSTDS